MDRKTLGSAFLSVCLSLGILLGVSPVGAVEWLPPDDEYFGVTYITDVSGEEGLQAGWASPPYELLSTAIPYHLTWRFGHTTDAIVYLGFRWETEVLTAPPATGTDPYTPSGPNFGNDDFTVTCYGPDGTLRWRHDSAINGEPLGGVSGARAVEVSAVSKISYIGDLTGVKFTGEPTLIQDFYIRIYDTSKVPNTPVFEDIYADDIFFVEFKPGSVDNNSPADRLLAGTQPNTYRLATSGRYAFRIQLARYDQGSPRVLYMNRVRETLEVGGYIYGGAEGFPFRGVEGPFRVRIVLSERPKAFTKDHIEVTNGTVTSVVQGTPMLTGDLNQDGIIGGPGEGSLHDLSTGRTEGLYQYLVTINPTLANANSVRVSVKDFEDLVQPVSRWYRQRRSNDLVVPVNSQLFPSSEDFDVTTNERLAATEHLTPLPEKLVIPANGYLVLAKGTLNTGDNPSGIEDSPAKPADKKTPAEQLYNIVYGFSLPFPGNDLANFFRNGDTLQLLHANLPGNAAGADADKGYPGAEDKAYQPGDVIISEIMWGLDRWLTDSQYIELHNTTNEDIGIDKNEWVLALGSAADPIYTTVVDVVSNNNPFWQVPGASGSTLGTQDETAGLGYAIGDLVSMSRIRADGSTPDGWAASVRPSANLHGHRIGTPGAPNNPPMVAVVPPTPLETPVATTNDIRITEVMVDTSAGQFPQWVELANVSSHKVHLDGWSISVLNNAAEGLGGTHIPLEGLEIPAGQVVLLVSGAGRQGVKRLPDDRIVDVGRVFLSETGFLISLLTPNGTGDMAGNFTAGWTLPPDELTRRSLVRVGTGAGTDATSWMPAPTLRRAYVDVYYGAATDTGTPGWHGQAGALPVELSLFVAERNKDTGAVELRWETQSERNNAGFSIKRSETLDGEFSVINATMIPGAGTTAEKQSYTYTDTTAKPNAVYYYQIEDVSLDGERQVLTRPHRLRGHLSASGKAAVIWGDLKSRE